MKNLHILDLNRVTTSEVIKRFGGPGDATCGIFDFPSCIDKAQLLCMAACSDRWQFVSVSRRQRTPNWREMEQIRLTFFEENELVVQFHLQQTAHAKTALYMWHPLFELELPPGYVPEREQLGENSPIESEMLPNGNMEGGIVGKADHGPQSEVVNFEEAFPEPLNSENAW